jgi:cyclopropane fatty-acyl-phospholipid synthase-like methyltransferase
MRTNERLAAAIATLRLKPTDRVLEIGCGFGVAASLICEQIRSGSYVAVDRSEASVRAARKRNRRFIETGRAEFYTVAFEAFDPNGRTFDKIVAIRVRAFRDDPEGSRSLVSRWLAPGGEIFVVYDEPAARGQPTRGK